MRGTAGNVYPEPGEVIWADSTGITCRRWNWRQCRRTQLTEDTQNVYFVLDRLAPYSIEALMSAGEDLMILVFFAPAEYSLAPENEYIEEE